MPANCEELFPVYPILEERLGKERFVNLPEMPGVYRFYDENGEVLYVGKANNLRVRLNFYRRVAPGKNSRKVSMLVSRIHDFRIDLTDSEQEALLLENQLIRANRPVFNQANKETETYYFVYLNPEINAFEFRLMMQSSERDLPGINPDILLLMSSAGKK
jgi:excinuclease UvrABC nuclease subunit